MCAWCAHSGVCTCTAPTALSNEPPCLESRRAEWYICDWGSSWLITVICGLGKRGWLDTDDLSIEFCVDRLFFDGENLSDVGPLLSPMLEPPGPPLLLLPPPPPPPWPPPCR
uniref:Uncharacterized protein n=1 Tax=Anopheles melas TaxID=34690 RepID=A0A182TD33_9DIPT